MKKTTDERVKQVESALLLFMKQLEFNPAFKGEKTKNIDKALNKLDIKGRLYQKFLAPHFTLQKQGKSKSRYKWMGPPITEKFVRHILEQEEILRFTEETKRYRNRMEKSKDRPEFSLEKKQYKIHKNKALELKVPLSELGDEGDDIPTPKVKEKLF